MIRRLFLAIIFATGLLFVGCLSPTLPLPPPEDPDFIEESSDGIWDVRGSNTAGSLVIMRNLSNGLISGVEDTSGRGRYFIQIEGELCDQAEVFEIVDHSLVSSTTRFYLEPTVTDQDWVPCQDRSSDGD